MPTEIERRFFVDQSGFIETFENFKWSGIKFIEQAYLTRCDKFVQRVRIQTDVDWFGEQSAYLTTKANHSGILCSEYEYKIPLCDARELTKLGTGSIVQKIRYKKRYANNTPDLHLNLEIDVFTGSNTGLVIVEVELPSEATKFVPEDWFGDEITGTELVKKLSNAALSQHPLVDWKAEELELVAKHLWVNRG